MEREKRKKTKAPARTETPIKTKESRLNQSRHGQSSSLIGSPQLPGIPEQPSRGRPRGQHNKSSTKDNNDPKVNPYKEITTNYGPEKVYTSQMPVATAAHAEAAQAQNSVKIPVWRSQPKTKPKVFDHYVPLSPRLVSNIFPNYACSGAYSEGQTGNVVRWPSFVTSNPGSTSSPAGQVPRPPEPIKPFYSLRISPPKEPSTLPSVVRWPSFVTSNPGSTASPTGQVPRPPIKPFYSVRIAPPTESSPLPSRNNDQGLRNFSCSNISVNSDHSCNQSALKSILKTSANSTRKEVFYKCLICIINFSSEEDLERHMKRTHQMHAEEVSRIVKENEPLPTKPPGSISFSCVLCDDSFGSLDGTKNHITRFHKVTVPTFHCMTCGEGFLDSDTFKKHVQAHSSGNISVQKPPEPARFGTYRTYEDSDSDELDENEDEQVGSIEVEADLTPPEVVVLDDSDELVSSPESPPWDRIPVLTKDPIHTVKKYRVPAVTKDPVPVVTKDRVPAVTKDPVPAVTKDPVPAVTKDPVDVAVKDQVPVVAKDPVLVVTKDPAPDATKKGSPEQSQRRFFRAAGPSPSPNSSSSQIFSTPHSGDSSTNDEFRTPQSRPQSSPEYRLVATSGDRAGLVWRTGRREYSIVEDFPAGDKDKHDGEVEITYVGTPSVQFSLRKPRRKCSFCRKSFSKSYYRKHRLTHMQPKSVRQKEKCLECDKMFTSKQSAKAHCEKEHYGRINYVCEHCRMSYYRKSDVNNHISIEHEKVRFVCADCVKIYKYPSGLQTHNRSIHSPPPLRDEPEFDSVYSSSSDSSPGSPAPAPRASKASGTRNSTPVASFSRIPKPVMGKAQNQAKGKDQNQAKGKAQNQAKGKDQNQAKGKAQNQAKGKDQNQAKGKAQNQAKGKANDPKGDPPMTAVRQRALAKAKAEELKRLDEHFDRLMAQNKSPIHVCKQLKPKQSQPAPQENNSQKQGFKAANTSTVGRPKSKRGQENKAPEPNTTVFDHTMNKSMVGLRVHCTHCAKDYAASYIKTHMQKAHPHFFGTGGGEAANRTLNMTTRSTRARK